jgi:glycosyltransferase involved in cell wall biosynthesis
VNQASNTKCYNILTLNYEFPPLGGGAASVSYEIAKRYVEKGFKVDVVTMDYKGLPDYEVIEGINIFRVKCLRRRVETCETFEMLSYVLSATAFLFKRLKKTRYDFCHCHFLIPTGVVALFLKYRYNLPFLVTIHGSDIPGYNPDRFKNEHYFTAPLLKLIAKNANNICSPSFYLKKLAEDKLGNLNITHIPNGIDLVDFKLN